MSEQHTMTIWDEHGNPHVIDLDETSVADILFGPDDMHELDAEADEYDGEYEAMLPPDLTDADGEA